MVTLSEMDGISAEVEEFIATQPFHQDGLRQLAGMLPGEDAQLHRWMESAGFSGDGGTFAYLFAAAAIGQRRFKASHLNQAITAQVTPWHIAWVAWRTEGDVIEELQHSLEVSKVSAACEALVMFVMASRWPKDRPLKELPRERFMRSARDLMEQKDLAGETISTLQALGALLGSDVFLPPPGAGALASQVAAQHRRQGESIVALLEGPFEKFVYERQRYDFVSSAPRRRAVARIGRNEKCPCGSGKKYKQCCEKKDQERLRHSSFVAGATREELNADPRLALTETGLADMRSAILLQVEPGDVPIGLQAKYLLRLAELKFLDEAIAGFQVFAKGADGGAALPEHLHAVWKEMFQYAVDQWRADIAEELIKIFPDAEEKLGHKPHAGIRLLLTGHNLSKAMAEVADTTEALLKSGDLEELQKLIWGLLDSPYYRAIGILLARGLLPLVDEKSAPILYERMLKARAKLNLSPEDEFGDWMDQQALSKSRKNETAAMQEAQDKLAAKIAELHGTKEERARLERELALRNRQERRVQEKAKAAATPDEQAARERAELKAKIERLNALVLQRGSEKLALRRELEKADREKEALKAEASAHELRSADKGEEDDDFQAAGNQPVRLLEFPKDFAQTLAGFPRHVGRAVMNRLGQIASGEPGAFERVKQLKAYPEVLRARVADKHRLLFCLTPDRVRVVDLIWRADLDRRIERLQASGLPPVG